DAQVNRTWSSRVGRYELADNPGAKVSYHAVPLQKAEAASLRPQVLALMVAAGFILVIACANLAGLTLVRMMRRTPEVATRLALGASGWQIQRQFWIENLLLALVGGALSVVVGFLALRELFLLLPEHFLPVASVPLDSRVMIFTLAVSVLTSVLFGLLIRTLIHLETLPPRCNPHGVMVAKASLDDVRYHDPATFRKLLDESTAGMRQIPGVENAAVGLNLPYEFTGNDWVTLSDGKE